MARPCPVCDRAYGEHSVETLAQCMDDALGDYAEDVTGQTLSLVL